MTNPRIPVIETLTELPKLRTRITEWKRAGLRIGFVPTMGNLHAGHQSLIALAKQHADRIVASVFVNPTQFGPNEDFHRYPRTPERDVTILDDAACDAVWMPSVETMYPFGAEAAVRMRVPGIADALDGAHRPGHFDGVVTVVSRLLNQIQPEIAVFGKKDYQQLAVIRYFVRDLAFPVEIIAAPTHREPDGLAMSSRNQYLSEEERARAPQIYITLQAMRAASVAGADNSSIEMQAHERLVAAGFVVDYAVLRKADLVVPVHGSEGARVALIAARLGRTRLIDNIEFESPLLPC